MDQPADIDPTADDPGDPDNLDGSGNSGKVILAAVGMLVVIALMVVLGVYVSRPADTEAAGETRPSLSGTPTTAVDPLTVERPRAAQAGRPGDHWHAAIGFNLCGTFLDPIESETDPVGIHPHGDGIVHIHPFSPQAAGANATLGVFLETVGIEMTATDLVIPGQPTAANGMGCSGSPGTVQVRVWPTRDASEPGALWTGDPNDIPLLDNQLITVAFLPAGVEVPRPPSEGMLDQLTDIPESRAGTAS